MEEVENPSGGRPRISIPSIRPDGNLNLDGPKVSLGRPRRGRGNNLDDMPVGVLANVTQHLDGRDVRSLRGVNSALRRNMAEAVAADHAQNFERTVNDMREARQESRDMDELYDGYVRSRDDASLTDAFGDVFPFTRRKYRQERQLKKLRDVAYGDYVGKRDRYRAAAGRANAAGVLLDDSD